MIPRAEKEEMDTARKPRASGDDPDDKFKAFNWLT